MYSSALSIEIISDVEFSRRLVESRSDKLKQEKTIQLAPSTRKSKPMQEKNNSTRQHERNNSTQQQERTTQLVSRTETTQLCTAVDHLQTPAPPLQQNRLFLPTPR
ncbi:hypothetical protein TNCV_181291 [Trichonephila clavipes]|nr:hypothetical protein TNCV_181291 [Trichonephila clavipes]